jgi:hypothetical protein
MTGTSIFFKLVTNEDSFTQLLRNLMVRSAGFRGRVLSLFLPEETAFRIRADELHTQQELLRCGRPDLVIDSQVLYAVIEVKVSLRRGVTEHQGYVDSREVEPTTYVGFLARVEGRQSCLAYIVPKRWAFHKDLEDSLDRIRNDKRFARVLVPCPIYWEQLLTVVERAAKESRDPFLEEFSKLLFLEFGPIRFQEDEMQMLYSKDFSTAYRTLRKAESLVDDVRARTAAYLKSWERGVPQYTFPRESDENAYGFYVSRDGHYFLWFGIWLDVATSPLCFGVEEGWGGSGLQERFSDSCKGGTVRVDKYLLRLVAREAFQSDDPVETIWSLLLPSLEAIARG